MSALVEVRHIVAADVRSCSVWPSQRPDVTDRWLFLPQTCGGAIAIAHQNSPRCLTWHLDSHSESSLLLQVADLVTGPVAPAVQLAVSELLFPGVAAGVHNGHLWLCLLTSSKSILYLQLPLNSSSTTSSSSGGALTSVLLPERGQAIKRYSGQLFEPQQLSKVGTPTSMTITQGHLVVSGTSDNLVSVPLQALAAGSGAGFQDHGISNSMLKGIFGNLYSGPSTGAAAALPLGDASGRQALLLLHQDGSLRGMDLAKKSSTLFRMDPLDVSQGSSRGAHRHKELAPTTAVLAQSSGGPASSSWVVWQMDPPEGSGGTLVGALQVVLPPEGTGWQRSQHVLREFYLPLPVTKGRVVSAALAGQQLLVLLSVPGAAPRVCAYSAASGELLGEVGGLHGSGPRAWGVHQDLWRTILECFPSEASPATSVTERLVTPGQLCLPSLAATLSFWGGNMTPQQLQAASVQELKVLLQAAAAAIQGRHPSYDVYECWQALFDKYCEVWDQQHGLLALLPPAGQWAGCYRAGGLLSLLRPQAAVEARRGGGGGEGGGVGRAWERGVVRQCLGVVRELLGGPCLTLMTQLVMSGVPLTEVAPPFLDLLLRGPTLAPATSAPLDTTTSPRTKARQQRLETWQAGRGGRLMQVQQALAGLEEPLSIIGDYVSDWGSNLASSLAAAAAAAAAAAPPSAGAATGLPPVLGLTLTSVTRQLARAACQELQALSLLLHYLLRHGSAGGQQLLANEAAEVEQELLPRVTEQLKVASMAMWLCRTPAEVPLAAAAAGGGSGGGQGQQQLGVGPLLDLQMPGTASRGGSRAPSAAGQHNPSSSSAPNGTRSTSSRGSTGGNLQPMAVHFLHAFCSSQPGAVQHALQGDIAGAALQLLQFLMGGLSGQQQWPAEGGVGAADTAVRLAYVLFLAHEYAAVAALVKIAAGGQLEDPGLRCMLGLSMVAGRPRQAAGTAADAEVLQAAQQHLLAATPGLHAGALHEVLIKLLRRLGGSTLATAEQLLGPVSTWQQADAPEPLHAAAYSLVFSEVVMKLFEGVGCYSGALAFAAACHDLLPAVFAPSAADPTEAQAKSGELSSYIFKYACELGDWQRAYEAVAGNVVDQRKLDDTQRLVGRLVEAGARQVLCRLPWEGVVVRSAGQEEYQLEAVPLRQVVAEALERQALHASDQGSAVARYQLAADFLLTWDEWRRAAAAHLGLARRLRAKGMQDSATLAAVQAAYDSAQLLLACVPQQDAWLDRAGCRLLAAEPAPDDQAAPAGLALLFQGAGDQEEDVAMQGDQDCEGEGLGGSGREDGLLGLTLKQLQEMADSQVVTLPSLQREAARFTAATVALQQVPDLRMLRRSPEDAYLLQLLLTGQRYGAALQLAAAVWKGAQLEGQLEGVASAMALEACQLQSGLAGLDAGTSGSSWGAGSACGALGGPAAAAWQQLQDLLQWCDLNLSPPDPVEGGQRSDGAAGQPPSLVGGRLRIAVINTLLTQHAALELPAWLTDCFKPRLAPGGMAGSAADPAALLRVYLQHGRLLEAGELVLEHLAGWQAVRPLERTKSSATVWLPLHHIQQLLGSLEAVKEGWGAAGAGGGDPRALQAAAEAVDELAERLRRGLQGHVSLVAEDSHKAAAAAAR